jgi:hypothetical protein
MKTTTTKATSKKPATSRRDDAPARDSEDYMYKLYTKQLPSHSYDDMMNLLYAADLGDDDFEFRDSRLGTQVWVHRELPKSPAGKRAKKALDALPNVAPKPKRKRPAPKVVTCPTCGCVRR